MGKNRHSKDKLFITATEWSTQYGGKKSGQTALSRPLSFDHCALSLAPFVTPVLLGSNGVVFDLENIVPYLKEYKCDPVTGDKMTIKNIIRLKMEKNSEGLWHCPVTCKIFNNSSHVVAIKTTGNVYSFDAVNELNIKSKNYTDLLTGEKFEKADIITLQEPLNPDQMARRDINTFVHLKQVRADNIESRKSESKLRHNPATESIMKEIEGNRTEERETGVKRKTIEDIILNSAKELNGDVARFIALEPITQDVNPGQVNTDGKASSSLTSSSVTAWTSNATRAASAEEIREARWKIMRQLGKKGYAQLQTTHGNLNVEVHCDMAMRTSWNFLTLANQGYYDGNPVHRLIPDFMLQTGDPSGSGSGGDSAFNKKPFKDEFDSRLQHSTRGVLSMANSGPNSNNSQFFVTFKATNHLDLVHSVFGRVVGGMSTLDAIEQVGADKRDKPKEEVTLLKVMVFTDPIVEADQLLEEFILENKRKRLAAAPSSVLPPSSSLSTIDNVDLTSGVGNTVKRVKL